MIMHSLEPNDLMLEVKGGNQAAFRQLAKIVSPKAFAIACRLLGGDSGAAEDVLQDVLLKLWQQAPKWEAKGSVVGYVQRMIYTTSIDKIRQRKTRPEQHGDEIEADVYADNTPNAQQKLMQKQETSMLYQLLNTLPERQRSAMVLTYFQELPQKDVATALGTSVKAVESLLIRAKRTLKQTAPQHGITLS